MTLDQRQADVLFTIVRNYIQSGQPVGSRTVARQSSLNLSPASIRNIMADLAEEKYIEQPHTSAGRIPSTKGIRYYLDSKLDLELLPGGLEETIKSSLSEVGPDLTNTLSQASKVLSSLSNQISLVVTPSQKNIRWKHIDFILLRPGLVMSILVMEGGMMQNKVVNVDSDISADDLVKFSNYLNDHYQGKTLQQVRTSIVSQMEKARRQFDHLYQNALKLARESFDPGNNRQVYVDGTHYLFQDTDFTDLSKMREVFRLLEERSKLLKLLDNTLESDGLSILMGQEQDWEELSDYAVISSPYSLQDDSVGHVSIIGPTRMNYSRIIPTVDLTARILSQIFRELYENNKDSSINT
ncbi:heat-inducible transcription repressor HrcA [Desulfonatronospira thiodismutans ASO3-1]|uniref:Heat-inducible transcription repressor HrcA n=1 Tax=Desulfonatronospira thiodismutans ASO3-1 TaxID=555779 RepID=D6SMV1_9BACT|nr:MULTISPECIES: heat-inducible transcriptional repressor HrcA [Desulfonatronospira]EFI36012.1 heat-inducible transcription repressor HrcA [Desulfonatronospira thiodismutans ASO3-1]RQD73785.1 MAG: heat-inducible transcription repressor HrcA [Desulfonatronospira sp. MSAO_Bac3]